MKFRSNRLPEAMRIVKKLIPSLLLMGLAFVMYSNTFLSTWTYDDFKLIVNNPDIRSVDQLMKNSQPGRIGREISLMLDYKFFGLNPAGFHIQNILWHSINAILIMMLVGRLGGSRFVSLFSAVLFAIHPVQVEVVANMSHRKDSIALAFILLSFLAYMEVFRGNSKKVYYFALSMLFFIMAIMTKENALILPVIFIVYECLYIEGKDRFLTKYRRIMIFLFACIGVFAITYYLYFFGMDRYYLTLENHLARQNYFGPDVLGSHYMLAMKSYSFMLLKLIFPLKLAIEYTLIIPDSSWDIWVLLTFASMFSIFVILLNYKKFSRLIIFSLCWLALFLLPTSNIFPLSYYAADRYLYTPSVGFIIIMGVCFDNIKYKTPYVKYGAVSLLITVMIFLTWNQNAVWRTPTSLWAHVYKVNPLSAYALNNNGNIALQKGEVKKAMEFFHKAVELNRFISTAQYNLGLLYENAGDREKARQYFENFVRLNDPEFRNEVEKVSKKLARRYNMKK